MHCTSFLSFASIVFCSVLVASAEVKVAVEHNVGEQATKQFKFKEIPSPAKEGAAAKTSIEMIDGEKDGGCRDASDLNNSTLPEDEDAVNDNFFFDPSLDGGRLQVDMGSIVPIKQVNTYSWHVSDRGPQVYKLYAADGKAPHFNPQPKKGTDPATCGWTLVASVDTRPHNGSPGGQYGVSITDTTGTLGNDRYLLLDISRTEDKDTFGNTFYSRIDVVTVKPTAAPSK